MAKLNKVRSSPFFAHHRLILYFTAIQIFDSLRVQGVLPEPATYKSILHAFEDVSDIDGLVEVYEEMKQNKIELDHVRVILLILCYKTLTVIYRLRCVL